MAEIKLTANDDTERKVAELKKLLGVGSNAELVRNAINDQHEKYFGTTRWEGQKNRAVRVLSQVKPTWGVKGADIYSVSFEERGRYVKVKVTPGGSGAVGDEVRIAKSVWEGAA